ncbi:MAG: PD40 domain-containing protein [Nitrospirae bacterium]|nr:PD40 domain-containing protein [Nitrospirota bacterium]
MYWRIPMAIFIAVIYCIFSSEISFGYGSNYTHPAITALSLNSLEKDGALDRYLRNELDLQDGLSAHFAFHSEYSDSGILNQIIRNNDVYGMEFRRQYSTRMGQPYAAKYLMISGSEAEDHPTERSQHHFLDPVSNSGLDNDYYGAGVVADFLALFYPSAEQGNAGRLICSTVSLCEPGFNLDGTSAIDRVSGNSSGAYPYNYFAWPDTRSYFYDALTSDTKEERDHFFAMTFFSLGHSLHLLEDMAVPAHTRNDFLYDHIWNGIIHGSYLEGYVEEGRAVNNSSSVSDRITFKRLSDFWDNDGTNSIKGLAEYTNYNFLSEGTVFKKYGNPDWVEIEQSDVVAEDGQIDTVQYYTGLTSDGIKIPHLAAVGLLNPVLSFLGSRERAGYTAYLDPASYRDYSAILIPRAAAYVSGLTEYFFRGRIAVKRDGPDSIKIKNLSTEPLNEGAIGVYYDSNDTGLRTILSSYVIAPGVPVAPGDETGEIQVPVPGDNVEPGQYIIVFKGRLGEEDGAVIGKVYSERLLFISQRNGASEIYSMSLDGGNQNTVLPNTDPEISYTHPSGSPDGTKIAVHSARGNSDGIWMFDLSSGSLNKVTDGYWPAWSSDGKSLLYTRKSDSKSDIYILNMETGVETRLTDDDYNNLWPAWSPDGSKIAYTSQRGSRGDIIIMDLNSRLAQNLTQSLDSNDHWKPAWSPDGARIAYESPSKVVYDINEPWYVDVHVLDINSRAEVNITNSDTSSGKGVWNGTPVWMDNERIVIESNASGDAWSDLWVVDANKGGFITRLTDSIGHDGYPFIW